MHRIGFVEGMQAWTKVNRKDCRKTPDNPTPREAEDSDLSELEESSGTISLIVALLLLLGALVVVLWLLSILGH